MPGRAIVIQFVAISFLAAPAGALEFSFSKIVDNTTLLPGSNQPIQRIDEIAFDGEYAAFRATGNGGTEGIYIAHNGQLTTVADESMSIPGGVGRFFYFERISVDQGNVVFAAQGAGASGVYTNLGGSLRAVVDDDMTMPGTTGRFNNLLSSSEFAIDGNSIVVSAHGPFFNGLFTEGVYLESAGALSVVADFRTPVPNGTGNFGPFDEVDIDDGHVVFHADGQTFSGYGAYTTLGAASGQVRTVVNRSTVVPGATNPLFMGTRNWPRIDGQDIAFLVQDNDFDAGIYVESNGMIRTIADVTTNNPETSDEFDNFYTSYAIDAGSVAFMSYSTPNSKGIFLHRNNRVHPVIGVADQLDGKMLSDVTLYPEGLANDKMLLRADFQDGTFGLYEASFIEPPRETIPIFPTFDVHAILSTPVQLFDGSTRVDVQIGTTVPERRVILDFPLATIPPGATIESAILRLDPGGTVGQPRLEVFGYAGNGVPESSDVSALLNQIGLSDPVTSLDGFINVELDTEFIQSLVGTSSQLGMVLLSFDGNWLEFAATDSSNEPAPTLLITLAYQQTLAGDFNADDFVDAADYSVWRDNLGSPTEGNINNAGDGLHGVDNADYAIWKSQFGNSDAAAAFAGLGANSRRSQVAVPEPAAALTLCAGLLAIHFCRRRQSHPASCRTAT